MKKLLFYLFILSSIFGNTQNIHEIPYIEVNGVSELEIIPDEIYVSITLRERIENKERITLEIQEKNVRELLKKININAEKLSLEDANSDQVKLRIKQKEVLSKVTYSLKLSTAKEVNDLFNGLYEIKIYDAYISKVYHSKMEEFKRDLRIKAIKEAKEKAIYLTNAIGNSIGKPLIINESYPISFDSFNMSNRAFSMDMRPESEMSSKSYEGHEEMSFKKIKLQSTVYIKYELK
ncbi:MAG: SIMPL domain-containing protein [Flavobacteriia bacterium]|nr:SIMPL domain-containing protein [Flavobacteriia bacterium]